MPFCIFIFLFIALLLDFLIYGFPYPVVTRNVIARNLCKVTELQPVGSIKMFTLHETKNVK